MGGKEEKDVEDMAKRTGSILFKLGALLAFAGIIPIPYTMSVRIQSPGAPAHMMRFDLLAILGFSLMITGIIVILSERADRASNFGVDSRV